MQIFHVEEDEDTFFYTMEAADSAGVNEYLPDTLAYRLQAGPLPQTDLLNILSGIFNGIKLIHEAGFAHRDIKPDNILFVKGVPKLADIGLLSSLSSSITQLAGTLEFIPPEARAADTWDSSDRHSRQLNDLYAFGKVIYCAATGMSPHEYPAVPANIPLSLPLKYFLRLSYDLCSKDPVRRLNSISQLEQELSDIERKLLYGETLRDKVVYEVKHLFAAGKVFLFSAWRLLKRYWYLMLLFTLFGGSAAYWIWKPEVPFDVTKQENKQYLNKEHKFSMTIPFQWEVVSKETLQTLLDEIQNGKKEHQFTRKQLKSIVETARQGNVAFYCDFNKKFFDHVLLTVVPMSEEQLSSPNAEEEFRVILRQLFEARYEFKTEIFASKKMEIQGRPAMFVDYSYIPGIRINTYWIYLRENTLMISLMAKQETFLTRQAALESVMKTLKIEK